MDQHENFLKTHAKDGGLLQSAAWGAFQRALGKETLLLGDGSSYCAQGITEKAPLASFIYFPRGPVVAPDAGEEAFRAIAEAGSERQGAWIRFEPQDDESLLTFQKHFGKRCVRAPHDIQPREILRIDLAPSEDELLARMKAKTRYNIRLAEKHGVTVSESADPEDHEAFLGLVRETSLRKGIRAHGAAHYRTMLESIPDTAKLFVAKYEGKVLAANIVCFFGDTATYLHGGASGGGRHVAGAFLLPGESMRRAKALGSRFYDLGGIQRETEGGKSSDWSGITRFKEGFAGELPGLLFPGTYDIILDTKKYSLYRTLRAVRNFFRF